MYSPGFYPFETPEEKWAFWSRHIFLNRYQNPPKPVYPNLLQLVRDKDYFVLTTNVDHCFLKAGFDKERLFYTQGDMGLWQCSKPCCQKTYDNAETVKQMVKGQKDMRVPSELVPYCPVCGAPMSMNLRADDTFAEDEGWHQASQRYQAFVESHAKEHILFWELGVGSNTPVIIKYPFWRMTYQNPNAVYACINDGETFAPNEIAMQSICLNGDIGNILKQLL
ncbi:NAD-dependent deacetylase [Bacteroides heparinolyticus]|uniref:SIR2 family NAD-dependent protein deacylase n=1 Tax=Prevotella heparinolytica TaxID=28113 RepID=UPI00359F5338